MKILVKNSGKTESVYQSNIIFKAEIMGYTDKSPLYFSQTQDGKKIYSTYEAVELYQKGLVDAIVLPDGIALNLLRRMIDEFVGLGVKREDLLIIKPSSRSDYTFVNSKDYTRLEYIELHVVDHCNLNCKGCVHFSPLVPESKFVEYDRMRNDLIQLRKKVEIVDRIHILGGEPLLNQELHRFVRLVREVYPFSDISIVTNGLLIEKMTEELVSAIIDTNTWINISVYLPIANEISEKARSLISKGIKVRFTDTITKFAVPLDMKGGHAKGVRNINCHCPNLYEGKLAVCPIICYMPYFNNYFGLDMDAEDGLIDIYNENLTYEELVNELHRVRKTCDKCLYVSREDCVERKWEQSQKKKRISDYSI